MTAQVVVYLGPGRLEKTGELLRRYGDSLRPAPGRPAALWLAPTARAATIVRERLIREGLDACLYPGVSTFDELASRIFEASPSRLRPISAAIERELLRRTVHSAVARKKLSFYADAAGRDRFVDLLAEHIRELRRHGVTAKSFARLRSSMGPPDQHRELAQLYSDYQALTAHALIDRESVPWAACDVLEQHDHSLLQNLVLVVVDGFSDFTPAQHKLLRLLARRAKQLLISLPSDDSPDALRAGDSQEANRLVARVDLYAKPASTLAELRQLHPQLEQRHFARRSTNWPALDHIVQHVFRHPQPHCAPAEVLDSLDRLEIVEAAGAQDEIVQIARRIKRLLLNPLPLSEGLGEGSSTARPGDIVVVFRSLTEVAPRIHEVFTEFGIPYALEAGQPLTNTPLVNTLLRLLRLNDEDWPFRQTVSCLSNNTLTAIDQPARRAADWLVRDLQIPAGRRALLDRVEQLATMLTAPDELGPHARRRVAAARLALPALKVLCEAFDGLPQEATATQWAAALARLGMQLGLSPFVEASTGSSDNEPPAATGGEYRPHSGAHPIEHADHLAWRYIAEQLASLDRLESRLGQPPRPLSRRDLAIALSDAARHSVLPPAQDEAGRVRVLKATTARTITAKHLFLAGMSEQAFPSMERPGRLSTESDYRFFARAAKQNATVPLAPPPAATRSQEEMLLFYELLATAEQSLTISYAALDDKAQTLPASPYVTEVRRTLGAETPPGLRCARPQLSPVAAEQTPLSRADWRLQAVAQALAGDCQSLAGMLRCDAARAIGSALDGGLRIVHDRAHRESFGPAEGLLTSEAAARRFGERFGPQHLWSPSQWETYAACPYKFFLKNVLHLEPVGDLVLETDFARRGGRLHQVLAAFHRQWPSIRGQRPLPPDEEAARFLAHLKQVLEERIAATPRSGIDAALLDLDRRQILKWAENHFEHHSRYDALWSDLAESLSPTHFELRFGPRRPGDADSEDPHSCDEPFTFQVNGEPVLVTGRIDRIDVARVGDQVVAFNVIDYKSGRKPKLLEEHIASGEHLQLPIYVEAAQALLFGGNAQPLAAGYWTMASGFDSKGVLALQQDDEDGDRWTSLRATVERRIGELIAGIRHGDFPVASRDDKCTSYCDFHTVCRITHIRSLGKSWQPEEQP